jgi:DNA-binding transcriptional LysR family regulator
MDLSQLEVFVAVARERRFSRAAEKLFRTQSAVSQTVRKLELEIGEPLFDRSSRDGNLTDAGRVLQEYAEKLLNLRQDAKEALVELRELQKGKLVMAANEFTALYLLPVLAEFRRLHPMIRIVVRRSLGSTIPDDVLKHNVEMGVLSYDPQEIGSRLSRRVGFRSPARARLGFVERSQHSPIGNRIVRCPHREFALSRQSHRSLPPAQDSSPHGRGTAHPASH